ncbi:MAG: type 1 glutamine amidotransferase [Maritimibacter sp.]|jgi:GMP synthase-like glutamine amidotransferase
MRIGILQTGHAPDEVRGELGDYADMFEQLLAGRGFTFTRYDVVDGVFPENPEAADGWIVTGSRHGVYEDHPWLPPLEEFIRAIAAADRPLIGVCFGHQVIAQALGGKVEKFSGGWAVGQQDYDFGGEVLKLNAWHQDQVIVPPEGAEVIASNAFCANAALAIGDKIFTIQPHPEFTAEMIAGLIDYRSAAVPGELVERAQSLLTAPNDNASLAERMAAVLTNGAQ